VRLLLAPITVALLLAGCAALPGAGPLRMEIADQAQAGQVAEFVLVDIDERVVATLARHQDPTFHGRFGDRQPPSLYTIGVGDTVQVTIWEAGAGGLFSAPALNGVSAGSSSATIPPQQVGQDGAITIPYAGRIRVAGRTTADIEALIVERLTGRAIQPQALVSVAGSVSNAATVLGEVNAGARLPLSPRGDRVLDVVAAAGGVSAPVHETFISLTRGGRTVVMPMQALLTNPSENVYVRPQDTITVLRRPQTFTAFGATGTNAVVPFDAVGITLEEAIAKAGGLLDQRADPRGVYLLRFEDAAVVRELAPPDVALPDDGLVRVIYRLDMRDAGAIFLGRQFRIRDKDALYVANAPMADLQKLFGLFGTITQPVVTGVGVANGLN
jgi:polysaccharide export outer membrane protein